MHHLTDPEGHALGMLALALRPDWARNEPGRILRQANTNGFAHAADYLHMVRALLAYATSTTPRYQTPNLYPHDGPWWRTTTPTTLATVERRPATGTSRAQQALDIARKLQEQEQASETLRNSQSLG